MVNPEDAFVFVDNHDNQRGHGAGGDVITYKNPRQYKIAQAITLAQTYGWPRVMSSFDFTNTDEGPPHNDDWSTKDVIINADGSCGNGWVCEHRWRAIAGMAGFAKAANGQPMQNWWNEGNKAAFSRGNKAFVVITNEGTLDRTFFTGLPAGDYCNVIEGCPTASGCTGKTFTVDSSGNARIIIDDSNEPIAAIHVEAMARTTTGCVISGSGEPTVGTTTPGSTTTAGPTTTLDPSDPNLQRTVIYMKLATQSGQDVFLLGGIDHDRRPGCTSSASTSACAIPIIHNSLGTTSHYDKHNAWRVGDTYLDWYGSQSGQGSYQGTIAEGTPAAWTSNLASSPGYQPDNVWGDHYWKVDFLMDCSKTESGWFEVKGYTTGGVGWEGNIAQGTCTGTAGGSRPYTSINHFARCGYQNVFEWGTGTCVINSL
jgi:alpha-amylase